MGHYFLSFNDLYGKAQAVETVPPLERYSCELEEQASEHGPPSSLLQFRLPASCLRPRPDFLAFVSGVSGSTKEETR